MLTEPGAEAFVWFDVPQRALPRWPAASGPGSVSHSVRPAAASRMDQAARDASFRAVPSAVRSTARATVETVLFADVTGSTALGERLDPESFRYVLMATLWGPKGVDEAPERVAEIRGRAETNRRLEGTLLRTRAQLEAMQGRFDTSREHLARAKALA